MLHFHLFFFCLSLFLAFLLSISTRQHPPFPPPPPFFDPASLSASHSQLRKIKLDKEKHKAMEIKKMCVCVCDAGWIPSVGFKRNSIPCLATLSSPFDSLPLFHCFWLSIA